MRRLALCLAALGAVAIEAKDSWGKSTYLQIPPELAYNGSGFAWATSPGTYAPKYNQRKARKMARRMGREVVR